MNDTPFAAISAATISWRDDTPVSLEHDDPYFSLDGGDRECRHVFIEGNDLERRFSALEHGDCFRIGETGFGTGLNFLETWSAFERCAPAQARLHFVSTEIRPLSHPDLRRAHQAWPRHSARCTQLQAQWPAMTPGFHTLRFEQGRVLLTLLYGDATQQLQLLDGHIDAWFLDGFAPARNESLWQQTLYAEIARLSHADTTVATYSAAGHVRRGLAAAGFAVKKVPGFASKRDMTVATSTLAQPRPPLQSGRHIVVAGAGLAGVTVAAALHARGQTVTLLDPAGVATEGSGNPAGIVYSTPSAHITAQNRFYQASYLHALAWMHHYGFPDSPASGRLNGLVQLPASERHRDKALAALEADFWPPTLLQQPAQQPRGSYFLPGAGYISPRQWCKHLLEHHQIPLLTAALDSFDEHDGGVTVHTSEGALSADALVLATAHAASQQASLDVSLKRIRGQVSLVRSTPESEKQRQALCHSGYWTPAMAGVHCVGASFNLRETTPEPRPEDDQHNLAQLQQHAPQLYAAMGGDKLALAGSRVGFRCQSPDFLPLAGQLSARVYCSIAHGSRGITGTPLCADIIAASICGDLPPADRQLRDALSPGRFRARHERRRRARQASTE